MLNLADLRVLTFDCYGTLIDWENGLWHSLLPIFAAHHTDIAPEELLNRYGEFEARHEAHDYIAYRDVLKNVLRDLGARYGFVPTAQELAQFAESIKNWQPFPDTAAALQRLQTRFKLAIISNIDDELFAYSAVHLPVKFDWLITAQQLHSYKPSVNNFHQAIARIGLPSSQILHVAQSLYHDIVPAKALGLATVWINRRHDKEGYGATPAASATPDLSFPDLHSFANFLLNL
ncbi:MAG: haloacid dehalogenase type II [Acidobacteria bacterium]|nr:haloacid dehalogenase type II [Acidobacteriota bacterium]